MENTLTIVGLSLIVIGWLAQFYTSYTKHTKYRERPRPYLSMAFISLYALGALFLAYAALAADELVVSGLNALAVLLSVLSYSITTKTMKG